MDVDWKTLFLVKTHLARNFESENYEKNCEECSFNDHSFPSGYFGL